MRSYGARAPLRMSRHFDRYRRSLPNYEVRKSTQGPDGYFEPELVGELSVSVSNNFSLTIPAEARLLHRITLISIVVEQWLFHSIW